MVKLLKVKSDNRRKEEKMRVILNFSPRKNGNCGRTAKLIADMTGAEVIDFAALGISPCGKCDYECFKKTENCPHTSDGANEVYRKITESDETIFVVPDFCDFPCSAWFVFSERQCGYFGTDGKIAEKFNAVPKKFIAITNTNKENFVRAFGDQVNGEPDILFLAAKDFGKISLNGDLCDDPRVIKTIKDFIG